MGEEEIQIQQETEPWGLLISGPMDLETAHLRGFGLYKVWGNLVKACAME